MQVLTVKENVHAEKRNVFFCMSFGKGKLFIFQKQFLRQSKVFDWNSSIDKRWTVQEMKIWSFGKSSQHHFWNRSFGRARSFKIKLFDLKEKRYDTATFISIFSC